VIILSDVDADCRLSMGDVACCCACCQIISIPTVPYFNSNGASLAASVIEFFEQGLFEYLSEVLL
jgi:hypothetical protein